MCWSRNVQMNRWTLYRRTDLTATIGHGRWIIFPCHVVSLNHISNSCHVVKSYFHIVSCHVMSLNYFPCCVMSCRWIIFPSHVMWSRHWIMFPCHVVSMNPIYISCHVMSSLNHVSISCHNMSLNHISGSCHVVESYIHMSYVICHISFLEIIYQLGRLGWQPLASSDLKRDWEVPTILMERMLTPLDNLQVQW